MATLAAAVGISMAIRVAATAVQFTINRAYRGIGFWAIASACSAVGFGFLFLRVEGTSAPVAIMLQNGLIVAAVVFEFVGTMRFLDRPPRWTMALSVYALFLLGLAYFTFVNGAIDPRTVLIHVTIAGFTFWTAWNLWQDRRSAIRLSTGFMAAVFALSGSFYVLRAVTLMFGVGFESLAMPSALQIIELLVVLVEGNLLTFGLIIMVGQRLHAESTESKDRFELLFNTSPDAAIISRLDNGLVASVNDGFTAMIGYPRDEAVGASTVDLLWDDPAGRRDLIDVLTENGSAVDFEAIFKRKDGARFVGMVSSKLFELEGVTHMISVIRDITERKALEDELKVRASTDALTGVANRARFMDVASTEFQRARRHLHPLSVALLDVDHFKRINDTGGHLLGDTVLVEVAGVIQSSIRSIDVLARFGGDEFVVLMPETGTAGAVEVAERIRVAAADSGTTAHVEACIGVATLHDDEESLDAALGRADAALYRAKQGGRNRVESE